MPAPQGPVLYAGVIAKLPKDFDISHAPLLDFIQNLCKDIATAWALWHVGLLGGSNNVNGAGIGAWVGVGSGGKLTQTVPFNIIHTWPKADPDGYWNTFKSAVTADYKEKFSKYVDSFSFSSVPYIGVCTATPVSPGPFSAINTPGPLAAYKASAEQPKDFLNGIRDKLPSEWSKNPDPLNKWLKALEEATIQQFVLWETASQFIGDTVIGTGAAGAGTGSGTSNGTGKVV